jgi:hypothetical protein
VSGLGRDLATGELLNKISIDVHLVDAMLPLVYTARDWAAAQAFLGSSDFHEIADRVEFITFTNREC